MLALYEDSGARKIMVTHWVADFAFSLPSVQHVIDSGLELRSVSESEGVVDDPHLTPL